MITKLLWVALGAAGALEADRQLDRFKNRFRPFGVTDALLDKVNRKLEEKQVADHPSSYSRQ